MKLYIYFLKQFLSFDSITLSFFTVELSKNFLFLNRKLYLKESLSFIFHKFLEKKFGSINALDKDKMLGIFGNINQKGAIYKL